MKNLKFCEVCDRAILDDERHFECEAEASEGHPVPEGDRNKYASWNDFINRRHYDRWTS